MNRPKIAIACQGGGSQTAFTAGVFKGLFSQPLEDHFEIVSLSGTSGGALGAFFLWYGLKKGESPVWQRLLDFWQDNTTQTPLESWVNDTFIQTLELTSRGLIPQYNLSPYDLNNTFPFSELWSNVATLGMRSRFTDFPKLLQHHIDFEELKQWGAQPQTPILLIEACDVLEGTSRKFNSYHEVIQLEHLLASACVPNLFPAVEFEETAYWDGLFSDNPPIDALIKPEFVGVEHIPDEIWVIKINPTTRSSIPTKPDDIADRTNELEGNISLFQGLRKIEFLNELFLQGAFKEEFLTSLSIDEPIKIPKAFKKLPDKEYHIPMIEMSEELAKGLNYESKLDRSQKYIHQLIEDGEKQGKKFIEERLTESQN
ncbi:MAG: patatin-like phospholipase family protein [Microcystaceae cyanobacterium]